MILFLTIISFLIILFVIKRLKLPLGDILFLILMPPFLLFIFFCTYYYTPIDIAFVAATYGGVYMLPALILFSMTIVFLYQKYEFSYIKIVAFAPIVAFVSSSCYLSIIELIRGHEVNFRWVIFYAIISIITGTLSTILLYYIRRRLDAN